MFGFNLKALDYYLVLNKRPVPNKQPGGEILKRQVKIHPSLFYPNKRPGGSILEWRSIQGLINKRPGVVDSALNSTGNVTGVTQVPIDILPVNCWHLHWKKLELNQSSCIKLD